MSFKRGYGQNGRAYNTNLTIPQITQVTFTVNHADTGGLGVTGVKSNGYMNYVFMNTNQTPGVTAGITNPNPQAGYCLLSFANPFNAYVGMDWTIAPPAANTGTTSTTAGHVYQITALGNTTLAQWQAVGFPQGVAPAVGAAFVATATQSIGGTGTVGTPGVPTITSVNEVGDPLKTITNSNLAQFGGAQMVLQFCAATNSSTTTLVNAAPADGTVVRLEFKHDGSQVTIDGL